jgi:proteic killer suppression protein
MIRSFKDKEAHKIFQGMFSTKLPEDIQKVAYRRLIFLHAAVTLADVLANRGCHLEKLKGNRSGQYSIRINDQYRICFVWDETGYADLVEIVDYH